MVIDSDFLNGVAKYARYNNTPRQILILLNIEEYEWPELLDMFSDPTSEVSLYYEKGKLNHDHEIIDGLENMILSGAEGAGEAARAMKYMKKQTGHDDLKRELFGL